MASRGGKAGRVPQEDRMEQITRHEEDIYYGGQKCTGAEEAYERFRNEYHKSIGREFYHRLDRNPWRGERVHGFGFDFTRRPEFDSSSIGKVDYRILGILCGAYCRMLGIWDLPEGMDDEQFWRWFDAAFSRNSGMLRLVGRKQKTGRTSKIYIKQKTHKHINSYGRKEKTD